MGTKDQKIAILGDTSLTQKNKKAAATDEIILLLWEKCRRVWREVFHHVDLKTCVFGTIGTGEILLASLDAQMKVLAFGKNAAHVKLVRDRVPGA